MDRLFSWFKHTARPGGIAGPCFVPKGEVVYAIGDIHGELRLLERLLDAIQEDFRRNADSCHGTVIFLGDYVDRGEDSRGVVERLLQAPPPGFQYRFLAGNHEQALLNFLNDPRGGTAWLEFGGLATLLSYGVSVSAGQSSLSRLRMARDAFRQALPDSHLSFFSGLEKIIVLGDYAFVHAGIWPGRSLDKQKVDDLLWIRSPFLESRAQHEKRIVHGHTIVEQVVIRDNRISVDTGAYATGRLSAVAFQGQDVRVLTATLR
ncbi:metallophosphoesterase family protein [Rhodospirillum sp. A1_3_36]|uniref:metallophosphoesterase family protein n=1 Tax=Rhodospirillum sp. A1_3_36 TaxID=3391666 RepID=UPI0039A4F7B9